MKNSVLKDPAKYYLVSVLANDHRYWSRPMIGKSCRGETLHDVALCLAGFTGIDARDARQIDIYELHEPTAILTGPFQQ